MEGEAQEAYAVALRLLAKRAYSVREMTDRLVRRGISRESTAEAVGRLVREGSLDDAAYARAVIHDRLLFHPVGRLGLRADLQRRGVPSAVIEEALCGVDLSVEEEAARRLVERRRTGGDSVEEKWRLRAWLLRRGFDPEAVQRVLKRLPQGDEGARRVDR